MPTIDCLVAIANIITAMALAGKDDYCMEYLKAFRANKLEL
jgi:hypothetical protein